MILKPTMNIPRILMRKVEEISENTLMSKERYNELYEKFLAWLSEEIVMPHDVKVPRDIFS